MPNYPLHALLCHSGSRAVRFRYASSSHLFVRHVYTEGHGVAWLTVRFCPPGLPPLVHVVVITLVVAARHVVHPLLVVEIPAHGLLYSLLKLQARLPAKLTLQLARVDGIAHVVALAVGHKGNEVEVFALLAAQQTVDGVSETR